MSRNQWRLLIDQPSPGAWNMAVDRAIQLEHATSRSPATLRIYAWSAPTLSLGRFQQISSIDFHACARSGIDVVRRPTGGRAVFHCDEVTYSVIAGTLDGIPKGVRESYHYFASVLSAAFENIGITVDQAGGIEHKQHQSKPSACYLQLQSADISAGARKLCGSAQVWHAQTVLQHGSFVLSRDSVLEGAAFGLDASDVARLGTQAITITQLLGFSPSFEVIRDSITQAFRRILGIDFVQGALSENEKRGAEHLLDTIAVSVKAH